MARKRENHDEEPNFLDFNRPFVKDENDDEETVALKRRIWASGKYRSSKASESPLPDNDFGADEPTDDAEEVALQSLSERLDAAIHRGDKTDFIAALAEGADPNRRGADGDHPVMRAFYAGNRGIFSAICSIPGVRLDERDAQGLTTLHRAAWRGDVETVIVLLKKGARTDVADESGLTALHYAAREGNSVVCSALLAKNADYRATTSLGLTARDMAYKHGHDVVCKLLDTVRERGSLYPAALGRFSRGSSKMDKAREERSELDSLEMELVSAEAMERAERRVDTLSGDEKKRVKAFLETSFGEGRTRRMARAPLSEEVRGLAKRFPLFAGLVDDIALRSVLLERHCAKTGVPLPAKLGNILIAGRPGYGKTTFAKALADLIGTGSRVIPMGSLSAGWILSGTDPTWQSAKCGVLYQELVFGPTANPVIVLDELDKIPKRGGGEGVEGSLYGLLERETAAKFMDEYAGVEIDASHVSWIATANDLSAIPEAILSRFEIWEMPDPTDEQAMETVRSVYSKLLSENAWGEDFLPTLQDDVCALLAKLSPRECARALPMACARAASDGRDFICSEDVPGGKAPLKRRIGFA